jgi:hypothetical protein
MSALGHLRQLAPSALRQLEPQDRKRPLRTTGAKGYDEDLAESVMLVL